MDLSRVLSAQLDLLASVYHLSVVTHKYKSAQQELLVSTSNLSVITNEQLIPYVAQSQYVSYLKALRIYLHTFFVVLYMSCII